MSQHHQQLILASLERARQTNERQHLTAWNRPMGFELPVIYLIRNLAFYADHYQNEYGTAIGEDGVLGPAWESALRGVRVLLTGATGRLNCSIVDGLICQMLSAEGFQC